MISRTNYLGGYLGFSLKKITINNWKAMTMPVWMRMK